MMRNLVVSFKKIFTSPGFYLCIAMTIFLLFAAEIYTDYDTQSRYSVIRALFDFSSEDRAKHYELYNVMIMKNARNGWLTLFAPIITSFCFVPQMCAERNENAVRFQIFRTSKVNYNISQFLSGVISGGFALAVGYSVFCAMVFFLFPNASAEFGILMNEDFNFTKCLASIWLYGAFWSIPAMFLTSVLHNKYLVMCIPFFVKYGLTQNYQKILNNAISAESIDEDAIKLANFINPDGILWINDATRLNIILLFGILAAIFFAAFVIIMQKRGDCGA